MEIREARKVQVQLSPASVQRNKLVVRRTKQKTTNRKQQTAINPIHPKKAIRQEIKKSGERIRKTVGRTGGGNKELQ